MFEYLKMVVGKIFSYIDMARSIAFIISSLNSTVTNFMDTLIDSWNQVLEQIEDPKELELEKQVAHLDVKTKTMKEFSASPSWIPEWMIDVYIKVKVASGKPVDKFIDNAKAKGVFKQPETAEEYQELYNKTFGNR